MIFKDTTQILTSLLFYIQGACFVCFLTQAFFAYKNSSKSTLRTKFVIMLVFMAFLCLKDTILLFDKYRSSMEVLHAIMLLDAFIVPLAGDFFFEFLWKEKWNDSIASKLIFIPSALIFLLNIITPGFMIYRLGVIYTLILGLVIIFMTLYISTGKEKKNDEENETLLRWVRLSLFSILFLLLLWTVLFWDDNYYGKLAINPIIIFLSFVVKRLTRNRNVISNFQSSAGPLSGSTVNYSTEQFPKTVYVTSDELAEKVNRTINEDKVYLNPKFSLSDWALMLGTNRTYLSEYINSVFKMNFYDYVNKLRIGEAKKRFEKGDYHSIDEVAQTCGYASISTFNRNFSKIMGMTPSNFIKTLQK